MARRNESPIEQPGTRATEQSSVTQPSEPTHEEIAARAYRCWQERGAAHGLHEEDWYRAEQELRTEGAGTAQKAQSASDS